VIPSAFLLLLEFCDGKEGKNMKVFVFPWLSLLDWNIHLLLFCCNAIRAHGETHSLCTVLFILCLHLFLRMTYFLTKEREDEDNRSSNSFLWKISYDFIASMIMRGGGRWWFLSPFSFQSTVHVLFSRFFAFFIFLCSLSFCSLNLSISEFWKLPLHTRSLLVFGI
jgi:hypothetical protein